MLNRPPPAPPPIHTSATDATALWRQLQQTAALVQAVQAGSSATVALEGVAADMRPGVQALGYTVLRRWGVARWLLAQLVPRKPPPAVEALLGSALALAWEPSDAHSTAQTRTQPAAHPLYSDFTLVNQAVEAAKRHPRMQHQAHLINACLRRFLRERADWQARCQQASPQGLPALLNVPAWWLQQLQQDHAQQAAAIVCAAQCPGPLTLRVNARHLSASDYLHKHLQPAGMVGHLVGGAGIELARPCAVQHLPGFDAGWVSVQDAGAQLAAPLLLHALQAHATQKRPLRLLDACAAPGGKTAHLLELSDHAVTALDVDAERAQRVHDTLKRLGLQASVHTADAAQPQDWWNGQPFDGILLDAPCTASGIVRRHPDIAWLRRPQDVAQLAAQQRRLLDALWPLLAPGGVLLYCTCSVFRAEGQEQMDAFFLRHNNAKRLPTPGHLLPQAGVPHVCLGENQRDGASAPPVPFALPPLPLNHDGFFYALLAKTA